MKLSIVVPVHNMAADGKLCFCLDALLDQRKTDGTNLQDYEIICVDDASTDASLQILRQYAEKYPDKVKIELLTENVRQGGARNRGMQVASGEWIGFMDSDDWPSPYMYASLLAKADETGADMVGCDYQFVSEHGFPQGVGEKNHTMQQTGRLTEEKYRSLILQHGSMVIKIYRASVIHDHKLSFPEKMLYEDNAAGPVWMTAFTHFEYIDSPLYYYYQHEASTVHVVTEARLRDRLKAGRILMEEAAKRNLRERFSDELEAQYIQTAFANTLFSYAINTKRMRLGFLREMRQEIMAQVPHFEQNPYYESTFDAEQKKLMTLFGRSAWQFWIYDSLLMTYRRIRYRHK